MRMWQAQPLESHRQTCQFTSQSGSYLHERSSCRAKLGTERFTFAPRTLQWRHKDSTIRSKSIQQYVLSNVRNSCYLTMGYLFMLQRCAGFILPNSSFANLPPLPPVCARYPALIRQIFTTDKLPSTPLRLPRLRHRQSHQKYQYPRPYPCYASPS